MQEDFYFNKKKKRNFFYYTTPSDKFVKIKGVFRFRIIIYTRYYWPYLNFKTR